MKLITSVEQLKKAVWPQQQQKLEELLAEEEKKGSHDLLKAVRHQVLAGGKRLRALIPIYVYRYLSELKHTSLQPQGASENASILDSGLFCPQRSFQCKGNINQYGPYTESSAEGKIIPNLGRYHFSDAPQCEQAAQWLGLAAELIHSGTLCHDDIMDEDRTRRNVPTVWVLHGTAQAINAGDLLFYLGEEAVHRACLPAELTTLLLRILAYSIRRVIQGQALEIEMHRDKQLPSLQSYYDVAIGKTGGLFALAIAMGGAIVGYSGQEIERLQALGMKVGEIFQIQDDILDLLGNKGRDVPCSDLWEGKPSWLVAHAQSHLPNEERHELARLLYIPRAKKTTGDVERIKQLLEKSGTFEFARQWLAELPQARLAVQQSFGDFGTLSADLMEFIYVPIS